MPASTSRLLTAAEVAERLNLPLQSVWKMGRNGVIPTVRIGARAVRFTEHDVENFIDIHTTSTPKGQRS